MYRGNEKYYNYTANEADEEREHRLSTLQKWRSGNARSLQYNYLLRRNDRQQQLHDLYNARQVCGLHVDPSELQTRSVHLYLCIRWCPP